MKRLTLLLALAILVLASSCSNDSTSDSPDSGSGKPQVYVSNYPLKYFAERLGGDAINVHFPAEGDGDPAFWKPGDADIENLQNADLILLNGATYEKWLDHVSLPGSIQVDTSMDLAAWFIEIPVAGTHSHGKDGEHSHSGTAFTTWLDFTQAQTQASAVMTAIKELPGVDANREDKLLQADLQALDLSMAEVAKSIGDRSLVASHPVYEYLARHYGLAIESVLWEPETVPDEEAMATLQQLLAKHPAKWMIWEGEPAPESVAKLEAIGVKSVVFDPCGNAPDEGGWLSVMKKNIENLKAISTP